MSDASEGKKHETRPVSSISNRRVRARNRFLYASRSRGSMQTCCGPHGPSLRIPTLPELEPCFTLATVSHTASNIFLVGLTHISTHKNHSEWTIAHCSRRPAQARTVPSQENLRYTMSHFPQKRNSSPQTEKQKTDKQGKTECKKKKRTKERTCRKKTYSYSAIAQKKKHSPRRQDNHNHRSGRKTGREARRGEMNKRE